MVMFHTIPYAGQSGGERIQEEILDG